MIITFSTENILESLRNVCNVAENKQNMPILANVYLKVSAGSIFLSATDLEVEVCSEDTFEGTGEIETTMNARKLYDMVKSLEGKDELSFNFEDNKTTISSGKSKFVLTAMDASEFPHMGKSEETDPLKINADKLLSLFNQTAFSMATQDARHYLNGLYLKKEGDSLTAVATDGHRLAISETKGLDKTGDFTAIIPRKCILELKRILAGDKDNKQNLVELSTTNKQISFKTGRFLVTSRLIEGNYPEYQKVVPDNLPNLLTIEKAALKHSLQQMAILSNEQYRGVKLALKNNELKLAADQSQDQAEDYVSCDYSGDELVVGFNVSYLLEAIDAMDEDKILMKLNNSETGCLLTGETNTPQYIIMPMRV